MIKLHSNNNYSYTLQGLSTYILIKEIFHHVKCKYWINELKEFLINFSMIIVPSVQCDGNLPKIFKIIHLKGLSLEFQVILILEGWLKKNFLSIKKVKRIGDSINDKFIVEISNFLPNCENMRWVLYVKI